LTAVTIHGGVTPLDERGLLDDIKSSNNTRIIGLTAVTVVDWTVYVLKSKV